MRFIQIIALVGLFAFSCTDKEEYYDLRKNANSDSIKVAEKYLFVQDSNRVLNYTRTLLCSWKLIDYNPYLDSTAQKCISCPQEDSRRISMFTQAFAYLGDNKNVTHFATNILQAPPMELQKRIEVKTYDARQFILEKLKTNSILMLNEAHDRVQTRAFLLSMLEDLRKGGATCLAMEMFTPGYTSTELDSKSGYYTNEPIGGQLVREALRLGYRLIAYEDFGNNRDLKQAENLFSSIRTKDGIEKTIVLGGYDHISEYKPDTLYRQMAEYFKIISKTDPYTIDQTDFIEASTNSWIKIVLDSLLKKKIVTPLAIEKETVKAAGECIMDEGFERYKEFDLFIYHPNTIYRHNRPTWLITSAKKDFFSVDIPDDIKPVLVQAYLQKEIKSDTDFSTRVPFDQTFSSELNKAWLVLARGENYEIVFRDENNAILKKVSLKL